jgi:hypothetical protein
MEPTPHRCFRPGASRVLTFVSAVLAILLTSAGIAAAVCSIPPDTDNDGVCDSVDNCIAVANPDQLDTYGASSSSPAGAFGDACEPKEAEVNVVKVKIRAGGAGTNPKGKITVRGDFVLLPGDTFNPSAIGARIVDGIALDQATPAIGGPAAACVAAPSGRSVRCKQTTPQAAVQTSASFQLSSASSGVTRVVKFNLRVAKLALGGMAFSEPVTVTLSDLGTGLDRVGVIVDCAASSGQLRCREL